MFDESAPFVPQHVPNESVPLSDQAAVEHEANLWALLWRETAEYTPPNFAIDDSMLKIMLPAAIRAAAKTFPANTGLGHDHISPRAFLRLSDEAIAALAKLFMAFEKMGTWAEVLDLVLIVLLPTSDGGFVPSGSSPP